MADLVTNKWLAPNAAPASFVGHAFEKTWHLDRPIDRVWAWLNDPKTFTDTQVWPFRVEFIDDGEHAGMSTGVLNIHHGPLMSFHGKVGEVTPPGSDGRGGYRDLQYGYGSYALSMRLARPTRLQFWVDAGEDAGEQGGCDLKVRLDSFVKPGFAKWWTKLQSVFWSRFPMWASKATRDG